MTHEIEKMMYVGPTPWHGLGTGFLPGSILTVDQAIQAAGLDWEVDLTPVEMFGEKIPGHFCTYRVTDKRFFGVVGKRYRPLQNSEAFQWFTPFLETGNVTIETAGGLCGGGRIWVLARIQSMDEEVSENDQVRAYILLSHSHDGSLPVRIGFTPVRVLCNNTLQLAHSSTDSQLLRLKHTTNLIENMASVREVMNLAAKEFQASAEQYRALAAREIDPDDLEAYVRVVFQTKEEQKPQGLAKIIHLFENGRGAKEAGSTYWGAYNAINEYLNYHRGKDQDKRLNSLWFGNGAQTGKRALEVALEFAA